VWDEFVAMKEESSERFVQLVVILSAPGVNVNWKNHDDQTPFDVACSNQQERDLIAEAGGLPSAGIERCRRMMGQAEASRRVAATPAFSQPRHTWITQKRDDGGKRHQGGISCEWCS
jgi:hypothetical protein